MIFVIFLLLVKDSDFYPKANRSSYYTKECYKYGGKQYFTVQSVSQFLGPILTDTGKKSSTQVPVGFNEKILSIHKLDKFFLTGITNGAVTTSDLINELGGLKFQVYDSSKDCSSWV